MKDIIPAVIGNTTPADLRSVGLPTNPVHVLDLGLLLPLAALTGIWIGQRGPGGYLLAGILLTMLTLIGASVVSATLFEHFDDPTISLGVVPLIAVVTLAGLYLLIVYLRNLREDLEIVPVLRGRRGLDHRFLPATSPLRGTGAIVLAMAAHRRKSEIRPCITADRAVRQGRERTP